MDPLMIVLRVLHIGAGVLWVGAAWVFFLFIGPAVRSLQPDAQHTFMGYLTRERRLTKVIIAATIVTVGAGAALYWIVSGGLSQAWLSSPFGISITIGAVAAIVAFAMGPTIVSPAFERLAAIGAQVQASGGPPSEEQSNELARVGSRLQKALTLDSLLLAVAVFFMATARYW